MRINGWKCDRCGKFFNFMFEFDDGVQYNVHMVTPADDKNLDLCEDCCKSLRSWVRSFINLDSSKSEES